MKFGPTQEAILARLMVLSPVFVATTPQEYNSALKLHDRGVLRRITGQSYELRPNITVRIYAEAKV